VSEPATIAAALRILARDIHCEDGVATLCLHEAANEIGRLAAEVARLRMSDEEHGAIERALECARAMVRYQPTMRKCFELKDDAAAIEAVLARHTRETVGG
jgi:hypothetical protein